MTGPAYPMTATGVLAGELTAAQARHDARVAEIRTARPGIPGWPDYITDALYPYIEAAVEAAGLELIAERTAICARHTA